VTHLLYTVAKSRENELYLCRSLRYAVSFPVVPLASTNDCYPGDKCLTPCQRAVVVLLVWKIAYRWSVYKELLFISVLANLSSLSIDNATCLSPRGLPSMFQLIQLIDGSLIFRSRVTLSEISLPCVLLSVSDRRCPLRLHPGPDFAGGGPGPTLRMDHH